MSIRTESVASFSDEIVDGSETAEDIYIKEFLSGEDGIESDTLIGYRLSNVVYPFAAEKLRQLALRLGRQIVHLDIGVYKEPFIGQFARLPEVAHIYAIDLDKEYIEEVRKKMQPGRLARLLRQRTYLADVDFAVMNGTELAFPDKSLDSASAIEVLVGLKEGTPVELFKEMGRVLRKRGNALINFADREVVNASSPGRSIEFKEEGFDRSIMEQDMRKGFGDDADIEWYWQYPLIKREYQRDNGNVSFFTSPGVVRHDGISIIDGGLLTIRPYSDLEKLNRHFREVSSPVTQSIMPAFWIAHVQLP
ncbi:class I SAM-dependent methyltransferase [Candidatus Roizmanbacteria bacterium]|nr:class I SAM-dependent methyltransferase [Candidatus Roizmanbacteria bacterium]